MLLILQALALGFWGSGHLRRRRYHGVSVAGQFARLAKYLGV